MVAKDGSFGTEKWRAKHSSVSATPRSRNQSVLFAVLFLARARVSAYRHDYTRVSLLSIQTKVQLQPPDPSEIIFAQSIVEHLYSSLGPEVAHRLP